MWRGRRESERWTALLFTEVEMRRGDGDLYLDSLLPGDVAEQVAEGGEVPGLVLVLNLHHLVQVLLNHLPCLSWC